MDYNKANKGVVCAVYNIMQKRLFYVILAGFAALLACAVKFSDFDESQLGAHTSAFYALCVLVGGLLLAFCAPRVFIVKLLGFLVSLGGIFVSLHNLNLLSSPLFYVVAALGAFLLFMLLSWFVYNARSSEVNEI